MKRIAVATRLVVAACMVIPALVPMKAGAAGVYENAAAEPAFLLSGRRITLRADLDFASNDPDAEASIYRVGAAFPLRLAFMLGVEQTFVSVSDSSEIEGGIGDLTIRGTARFWRGEGRAFRFLGYIATGTTKQEYFPYSSKTFDFSTSLAYVDSLGAATLYATAGRTWVNRRGADRPIDVRHTDYWRASAGAQVGLGERASAQAGVLYQSFEDGPERWIPYAGAAVFASESLSFHAGFQSELGAESQRVSDWAVSAGITVRFATANKVPVQP
jgi:hypothetical protein